MAFYWEDCSRALYDQEHLAMRFIWCGFWGFFVGSNNIIAKNVIATYR